MDALPAILIFVRHPPLAVGVGSPRPPGHDRRDDPVLRLLTPPLGIVAMTACAVAGVPMVPDPAAAPPHDDPAAHRDHPVRPRALDRPLLPRLLVPTGCDGARRVTRIDHAAVCPRHHAGDLGPHAPRFAVHPRMVVPQQLPAPAAAAPRAGGTGRGTSGGEGSGGAPPRPSGPRARSDAPAAHEPEDAFRSVSTVARARGS